MSLPIGYQNDAMSVQDMLNAANGIGASYVRILANPGSNVNAIRDRMRAARAAGKKIILTVGDAPGGKHRNPTPKGMLQLIRKLPQADQYTYTNEPDQTGRKAKQYANDWRTVRKVLGHRLLLGDVSPYGIPWLARVEAELRHRNGGKPLDVAIHPYNTGGNARLPGSLAHINTARQTLQKAGGSPVNWWFTEYGRGPGDQGDLMADLQRAKDAKARAMVMYDVRGPTWDTALSDYGKRVVRAASSGLTYNQIMGQ